MQVKVRLLWEVSSDWFKATKALLDCCFVLRYFVGEIKTSFCGLSLVNWYLMWKCFPSDGRVLPFFDRKSTWIRGWNWGQIEAPNSSPMILTKKSLRTHQPLHKQMDFWTVKCQSNPYCGSKPSWSIQLKKYLIDARFSAITLPGWIRNLVIDIEVFQNQSEQKSNV